MSRTATKPRSRIQRALIELRRRTGHSQTSFARLLNVAVATVGRWETTNEPAGITLATFERIANKERHKDLAKVFSEALAGLQSSDPAAARQIFEERGRWGEVDLIIADIQEQAETLKNQGNPIGSRIYDRCNDAWVLLEQVRLFSWRNR